MHMLARPPSKTMNQGSMPSTSVPTSFTNTILLSKIVGEAPRIQTIGALNEPRKKRAHTKSRRGCIACKLQRVKCDECMPCSRCVKRKIQCHHPPSNSVGAPVLPKESPHIEVDNHPQISLLHLELFHHWDKETRPTLLFPQVWPIIMQHAFDDQCIMSAILCLAARHLATLNPGSAKYARASTQLMSRAINLFRTRLSDPITGANCETLMGTALLINYISWVDLGFLDGTNSVNVNNTEELNFSQDQLFFLSPCIVQLWFQTIPILIEKGSVFTDIILGNPRLSIEESLRQRGVNPEYFVEPFIELLDDLTSQSSKFETPRKANHGAPSSARGLLSGLEKEAPWNEKCHQATSTSSSESNERILMQVKNLIARICIKSSSKDPADTTAEPSTSHRSLFTYIIRRLSPILCCESLAKSTSNVGMGDSNAALQSDIEQLLFGFPILCCGPFANLIFEEDSRALVVLFHFYRAVRQLLPPKRCWWAYPRSCLMEELITKELDRRGVKSDLYSGLFV